MHCTLEISRKEGRSKDQIEREIETKEQRDCDEVLWGERRKANGNDHLHHRNDDVRKDSSCFLALLLITKCMAKLAALVIDI